MGKQKPDLPFALSMCEGEPESKFRFFTGEVIEVGRENEGRCFVVIKSGNTMHTIYGSQGSVAPLGALLFSSVVVVGCVRSGDFAGVWVERARVLRSADTPDVVS